MVPRNTRWVPLVFRLDRVQAVARAAVDGQRIEDIATQFNLSAETVCEMLLFPSAPLLAAMNVPDDETIGTTFNLGKLRAYRAMLDAMIPSTPPSRHNGTDSSTGMP